MTLRKNDLPLPIMSTTEDPLTSRLKVDVAQTGFFEGREFRSFYEFNIASGQTATLRFSCPIDFILFQQALSVDSGGVKLTARAGATPGGTFGVDLPVVGKNRMSSRPTPFYEPQATIATGGTATGGTVVEVVRLVAAGATAQEATVGGQFADERGLPGGSYYIQIQSIGNGAATGVYSLFWEERP